MEPDSLLTRARLLPVSVVSDADRSLPTMDHGIRRLAGSGTVAGRAVTVRTEEAVFAKLADGGSLFASTNFRTHRENVLNGTPSKLGFTV